jgi:hypothetical protein
MMPWFPSKHVTDTTTYTVSGRICIPKPFFVSLSIASLEQRNKLAAINASLLLSPEMKHGNTPETDVIFRPSPSHPSFEFCTRPMLGALYAAPKAAPQYTATGRLRWSKGSVPMLVRQQKRRGHRWAFCRPSRCIPLFLSSLLSQRTILRFFFNKSLPSPIARKGASQSCRRHQM